MATRHFRSEVSGAEAAVPGGSPGQSRSTRAEPKERHPEAGPAPVDGLSLCEDFPSSVLWHKHPDVSGGMGRASVQVFPEGSSLSWSLKEGLESSLHCWSKEGAACPRGWTAVWMMVGP